MFLRRSSGFLMVSFLMVCVAVAAQAAVPAPGEVAVAPASPSSGAAVQTQERSSSAAPVPPALRHFLRQVSTFTADFTQTQTDDTGKLIKKQSGQVWLHRAASAGAQGRFRWVYEKPYKQLIVCDGDKVWVYDPDLEQVTVRPAKQVLAGSPAALLSQRTTLADAFNVATAGEFNGQQVVKLTPKNNRSDFKSVALSLKEGVPTRMVFRDQLGDTTEVRFSHVKTNHHIDADRFRFTPPKGVTVVKADASGG